MTVHAPRTPPTSSATRPAVLSVSDLTVSFGPTAAPITPVRGVSFDLRPGERLGIVGESGSGKSLTALAIMRLLPTGGRITGSVRLEDTELLPLSERAVARVRGSRIAMVYQDPMSALNPVHSIGRQVTEAVRLATGANREVATRRAVDLLGEVGVPRPRERMRSYPHEFSGGMRQRVVIAMALAGDPRVVIADEPTTALDVTTQARVIDLMSTLVADRGTAVILITHDLGVAASFCERIHVMYAGRVVERSGVRGLFETPVHPYTEGLLSSICTLDADVDVPILAIPGQPPLPQALPTGCSFHPRCPVATAECAVTTPVPVRLGDREAECLYAEQRFAVHGAPVADERGRP